MKLSKRKFGEVRVEAFCRFVLVLPIKWLRMQPHNVNFKSRAAANMHISIVATLAALFSGTQAMFFLGVQYGIQIPTTLSGKNLFVENVLYA